MKKLETASPKPDQEKANDEAKVETKAEPTVEKTEVQLAEKDIRCRRCSLLLAKIKSQDWTIQIKCRRCGYLGWYSSDRNRELVRENSL